MSSDANLAIAYLVPSHPLANAPDGAPIRKLSTHPLAPANNDFCQSTSPVVLLWCAESPNKAWIAPRLPNVIPDSNAPSIIFIPVIPFILFLAPVLNPSIPYLCNKDIPPLEATFPSGPESISVATSSGFAIPSINEPASANHSGL